MPRESYAAGMFECVFDHRTTMSIVSPKLTRHRAFTTIHQTIRVAYNVLYNSVTE